MSRPLTGDEAVAIQIDDAANAIDGLLRFAARQAQRGDHAASREALADVRSRVARLCAGYADGGSDG